MTFQEASAQIHPAFFVLLGFGLLCCLGCGVITTLQWTPGRSVAGAILLTVGALSIIAGIPVGILSA